jgi:LysM repeat protein
MSLSEKWKATMNAAILNPRSSAYDELIKTTLQHYQIRFAGVSGFPQLNWLMFKAVLMNESGGPGNPAWTTKPMQIGNAGDPGYGVLQAGQEGSSKIMSPQLTADIATKPISTPSLNIRAGIALILTKSREFGEKQIIINPQMKKYTIKKSDSLSKIANEENTTIGNLAKNNPSASANIQPGQTLNYQNVSIHVQWAKITPSFLAYAYNGGGDLNYADKITYLFDRLSR